MDIDTARDRLSRHPRVQLTTGPTPITKLAALSARLGLEILCKRDDLNGFAFGGNKNRKLEFLIGDALNKGAEVLIAIGAVQSNFCRMVAAAGQANGLEVHLILGGAKPDQPTANLLLDHLFGAHVHHVSSMDWDEWAAAAWELENSMRMRGRAVYSLPIGGSTEKGAFGYIDGFFEIMDDLRRLGSKIDVIVHATSSAGTQAGLLVGRACCGWPGKIVGIGVAKNGSDLAGQVACLARSAARHFNVAVDDGDVVVDSSFLGGGYAVRTQAGTEAITLFARLEGVLLDHVYTGKAAAGLMEYARKGVLPRGARVLFLHTGGAVELFQ